MKILLKSDIMNKSSMHSQENTIWKTNVKTVQGWLVGGGIKPLRAG